MEQPPVTYQDILDAARRIAPFAHRTPVITCDSLDTRAGCQVFLKCENLQRVGAFKFRGATNTIAQLSEDALARGVITHSSGNHGQAVALAARLHGIPATVVMPSNAPAVKRNAVRGYGATVVECEPNVASRRSTVDEIIAKTGAELIHPYNDVRIVAGQGTTALELLDEIPGLDAVLAPVGGGGLLSGCAIVCAERGVRLVGCEPVGADDAHRSLTSGERVEQHVPDTIADGLLTCLGELTFSILKAHDISINLVSEEELREAQRFVWERTKLIIEPSSAVAVAPLFKGEFSGRVGVVITGGNVDLTGLFGP